MINFKTLKVWELAHKITLDVYKLTSCFPKEEIYGLTLQMRHSSSSIPTNIAEG
jgi:four helix bundle protein